MAPRSFNRCEDANGWREGEGKGNCSTEGRRTSITGGKPWKHAGVGQINGLSNIQQLEEKSALPPLLNSSSETPRLQIPRETQQTPRIACLGDNLVTKSAPVEYLRGELHFYRSIPPELTHLFPTLVGASEDASQALPSMTITKASGRDEVHAVYPREGRGHHCARTETLD